MGLFIRDGPGRGDNVCHAVRAEKEGGERRARKVKMSRRGHSSLIQGFDMVVPVRYRTGIEVGPDAQSSEVITVAEAAIGHDI